MLLTAQLHMLRKRSALIKASSEKIWESQEPTFQQVALELLVVELAGWEERSCMTEHMSG